MQLRTRPTLALALLLAAGGLVVSSGHAAGLLDIVPGARERWRSFSDAERDTVRSRIELVRALEPEQRARLTRRAKRLERMSDQLYVTLPASTRARIDALAPEARREVLRDLASEEARLESARILSKLPSDVRQRVSAATQEDRERVLQQFKLQQDRELDQNIGEVWRALGLPEDQLAALLANPREQRRARLMRQVQRRVESAIERDGLPAFISPEAWGRVRLFSPEDFIGAVQRIRESEPDFGRTRTAAERRADQREEGLRRLRQVLRRHAEERLEPTAARGGASLEEDLRRQTFEVLRECDLAGEKVLAGLEAASQEAYFRRLRVLLSGLEEPPDEGAPRTDAAEAAPSDSK